MRVYTCKHGDGFTANSPITLSKHYKSAHDGVKPSKNDENEKHLSIDEMFSRQESLRTQLQAIEHDIDARLEKLGLKKKTSYKDDLAKAS